jgi:hypothetical protein
LLVAAAVVVVVVVVSGFATEPEEGESSRT